MTKENERATSNGHSPNGNEPLESYMRDNTGVPLDSLEIMDRVFIHWQRLEINACRLKGMSEVADVLERELRHFEESAANDAK